jgi:hypothetical protein
MCTYLNFCTIMHWEGDEEGKKIHKIDICNLFPYFCQEIILPQNRSLSCSHLLGPENGKSVLVTFHSKAWFVVYLFRLDAMLQGNCNMVSRRSSAAVSLTQFHV